MLALIIVVCVSAIAAMGSNANKIFTNTSLERGGCGRRIMIITGNFSSKYQRGNHAWPVPKQL